MMTWLSPKPKPERKITCGTCGGDNMTYDNLCITCWVRCEMEFKRRKLWREAYMAHAAAPGATAEDCTQFADDTVANWKDDDL